MSEAFGVVPMAFMREAGAPHGRMNVRGGASALGHATGARGAQTIMTLLAAMERRDAATGLAAIGDGEGMAVALERD